MEREEEEKLKLISVSSYVKICRVCEQHQHHVNTKTIPKYIIFLIKKELSLCSEMWLVVQHLNGKL